MPCYKPLKGYYSKRLNKNGKRDILFSPRDAFIDMPVTISCGRCIGCRLEKSRQWAIRCVHEAKSHKDNCFLTLTYNDEHLPKDGSLSKKDIQKFIKRVRKHYESKDIRYLYCGEYGENNLRPHYHVCLFGVDFHHDRKIYSHNNLDQRLYVSETLNKLWSKKLKKNQPPSNIGLAVIGDLSFQSSAYVARYITKKITGKDQEDHYGQKMNILTGELELARTPEFAEASRRPALGRRWFEENYKEVYPNDFTVVNKIPQKPPKYYDILLEKLDPKLFNLVKISRTFGIKEMQEKFPEEYESLRLLVKEEIRKRKKKYLPRSIE